MSLNLWSLLVFSAHILFYISLVIALASKSNMAKLVTMIVSWLLYQAVTLWYGIATHQIGFILMFVFQFIVSIVTILIGTERNLNEDI